MAKTDTQGKRRRGSRLLLRVLRNFVVGSYELFLALALVALLGTLLTAILLLSFPEGTALQNLYEGWADDRSPDSDFRYRGLNEQDEAFVAVLSSVQRRVRDRPATALSWREAHSGMKLRAEHTVQTRARSAASIDFGGRGTLTLAERSLIVIKQPREQEGLDRNHASIVLLGGRLRGEVGVGPGRSAQIEIVTPGGTSTIRARRGQTTGFNVALHEDESSTVSIYDGTVEIMTADGPRLVGPNEALTYDSSGVIGPLVKVPEPPRPSSPAAGTHTVFGVETPRVRFVWSSTDEVTSHRLLLARDPELTDVVYSGEIVGHEWRHGDLAPGDYYWTVTSISRRAESRPSAPWHFVLEQDLVPPALEIELPEEVRGASVLLLRGSAEAGAQIFVADQRVSADSDGSFEYALTLKRGLNMIVVEAIDAVGNVTYESRYVTARY